MERKKRTLWKMILFCCLMLLGAGTVKAAQTGNVSLQLSEADVEMTLYQVAETEEDGLYYTEDFADCKADLENLSQAKAQEAADTLAAYAKEQNLKGISAKTDEEGYLSFTDLAEGVYLLTQTGSQDVIAVQNMLFVIPQGTGSQKDYDVVLEAKSSFPGGAVILNKTDPDGNALEGAKFTLQVREGEDWKEFKTSLVTNQYGQIVVTDLPIGSYQFVETEAPKGYMLLEDPVPFEIKKAGQVAVVKGIYQKDSGEVEELDVVNAPDFPDGPLYDTTPTPSVTITITPSVTPTDGSDTPGGNTPGTPGNGNPGTGTPGVKTGDNSPILALTIMLLLAAAVITASIMIRKRNGKR